MPCASGPPLPPLTSWRAEKYLREVWPSVTSALKEHGVACELNLVRLRGQGAAADARAASLTPSAPRWRAP